MPFTPIAHSANIAMHVAAGVVAMAIGFTLLARTKGTHAHRRGGRWFGGFTIAVCFFAAVGLALFRFMPLFAVLTVLVLYQLVSGWHAVYTQARGPSAFDAGWTLLAALAAGALMPSLLGAGDGGSSVGLASLGALAAVLAYDTVRWLFPRRWYRALWRYEHAYKLNAALFGMLSAFVGNVVRVGQPWSQLAPSAVGTLVILFFFIRLYRGDRRRVAPLAATP